MSLPDFFSPAQEAMGGVDATLRGLTLLDLKKGMKHGEWGPFLTKHCGKARSTAAAYMRVARAYVKWRDAQKVAPGDDVQGLVRVWVRGRTFRQLLDETAPARKSPTREKVLAGMRAEFLAASEAARAMRKWNAFPCALVGEAELAEFVTLTEALVEKVRAFRRLPKSERDRIKAECLQKAARPR